jgi:glycosyltransferase involved in cell wall biosynthesis
MGGHPRPMPLLSIVIPTRNRMPYAISAIQSILEISDTRLELVVQDNGESRALEAWIQTNIQDARLQYSYCGRPLSFVDNFNAAVNSASGEYVCLIGDDDGINPEIMKAAEWAQGQSVDSLSVKTRANYIWPDAGIPSTIFTKVTGGVLTIFDFRGAIIDTDGEKEMRAFVRAGGMNYLNHNLPKLYHGLVRRDCLEKIKKKTGAYFGGLSPDIFASLAMACVAKRMVMTDYPLTLPGACGASASIIEGVKKRNSKNLEEAPHLRDRGEYHWSELVPRIYSVETIWADSGVAALRAMGRDDLVRRINLPRLAAYCIWVNRGVMRPVLRDLFKGLRILRKNRVIGAIRFGGRLFFLLVGLGLKLIQRAWNRFLMIMGLTTIHRIAGLENMIEASHALTRFLAEKGYRFSVERKK